MVRIRATEERIRAVYPEQEMRCPVHLHIGQEAVPAGVCAALQSSDRVFASHRSHGPYLALDGDLIAFFGELYGRECGCARGRGGSMHLLDRDRGYWGSSAIVGGTIPIAVGSALASTFRGEEAVSVAFFGDGACEEGVLYESLNFAALRSLPVLFVCENNGYATNSPLEARQARDSIAERSSAFGVRAEQVDGNDAEVVHRVTVEALARARTRGGPTLIEAKTYRWMGHVGIDRDDATGARPTEEVEAWLRRCPIERIERTIRADGVDHEELELVHREAEREAEEAQRFARESPSVDVSSFLEGVES